MDLLMELLDAAPAPAAHAGGEPAPTTVQPAPASAPGTGDTGSALRFITCGSVDDGKSTLIGRLLLDSRNVLQDQLAQVSRSGTVDLARFTDGLSAEREQGITIDVAYRYFSTAQRKFIIGDAPGHEQYTRNMVTAASSADAAVVLVDATKLPWHDNARPAPSHALLPQTRRHSLLVTLLRVPSIVFAINKLDAVADAPRAFANITHALRCFADSASITPAAIVPISALAGNNVVRPDPGFAHYHGPSLLQVLEQLPATRPETDATLAFPVQWVEQAAQSAQPQQSRRILWGRVAAGALEAGQPVVVLPGGQRAQVVQVLDHARRPGPVAAGRSAGIVLDREIDVSRGDWLLADGAATPVQGSRALRATVAWLDEEPLVQGRTYWAVHGHRWVKARVTDIRHRIDVHTLSREHAGRLEPNAIGEIEFELQAPLAVLPYHQSRNLGALVLVDTASHRTAGAALAH